MASKKQFEIMFKMGAVMSSSFSNTFKQANKSLNDMNKRTSDLKKNMEGLQSIAQKGLVLGGAGLAGAGFAVNEAIKFESAMADVKKVFSGTEAELASLNKEIIDMSTRLPMAANDIAKIAASAGQAGIATKEISRFTEEAVKMGVAFDISAEEAGQAMAEMRTAFKMNQDEVVTLADKINYLGNKTPAAAKGIMEIVQRIGPLGEVAGVASGSIAALGATMRGMGVQEEIAATGIKNTMLALVAGESATKSQRLAYAKLGLESTAVAKAMQKDSEKTVLTVLKGIAKLDKYEQAATLATLFGKESLSAIAPLLSNMGELEKNLNMVGDASKYAGSMQDEYAERAKTTEKQMILAKNTVNALAIEIGSTLLPYVNKGLKAFQNIIQRVREWSQANPELSASLAKWGVVLAAAVAGISALSIGLIALVGPILIAGKSIASFVMFLKGIPAAIVYLKTAIPWIIEIVKWLSSGLWLRAIAMIKMVGTAFMWLGRIFLLNPIGLAITAIIGVIYLLYKNWDTVVGFVSAGWDRIKQSGSSVMEWFTSLPSKFIEFGRNLLQGLATGIREGLSSAISAAGEAAEAVKNKVKSFFGINSPSKVFAQFGEWNMEGLANGMTSAAPSTGMAAQSAVSGALPSGQSLTNNSVSNSSSYSISITVNGGGSDTANQARTGVMDAISQIEAMNSRKKRLALA